MTTTILHLKLKKKKSPDATLTAWAPFCSIFWIIKYNLRRIQHKKLKTECENRFSVQCLGSPKISLTVAKMGTGDVHQARF